LDTIQIRPVDESELPEAVRTSYRAFGTSPTQADHDYFRSDSERARTLCALDGDRIVGVSTALSLELSLPGSVTCAAGGLAWLTVLPTYTRRGILRGLMREQLADVQRRQEPVSVLTASEGEIYGRFGFGPAAYVMGFSVERVHAGFAHALEPIGRMVMMEKAEALATLPALYEQFRSSRPGSVSRPEYWWAGYLADAQHYFLGSEGASEMFHVAHEDPSGAIDGYVSYRMKPEWAAGQPRYTLTVMELVAGTPQVYAQLWKYCFGVDLVHEVSFPKGMVDEPLRWLLADPRRFRVAALTDFLWVRLVDIPEALESRAYRSVGAVVMEVSDPFLPENSGRYELVVERPVPGGARCAPTTRDPDLELDVAELGSVYLGGVSFTALAAGGRVRELSGGAAAKAARMFGVEVSPHCTTKF